MARVVPQITPPSDDLLFRLQDPEDWEAECGEQLGTGAYRRVYVCKSDPTKVIKRARVGEPYVQDFHCLQSTWWEYTLWQYAWSSAERQGEVGFEDQTGSVLYSMIHILCPVYRLSGCGIYSLAERARSVGYPEDMDFSQWRANLPGLFEDICRNNCGTLTDGRLVILDYGNIDVFWLLSF